MHVGSSWEAIMVERAIETPLAEAPDNASLVRAQHAMERVPREQFVPAPLRELVAHGHPLPIGHGQTISATDVVQLMTALAAPAPHARVLEVGTGCGFQTAVLAELAGEVYSIEIVAPLAERARHTLEHMGYDNIHLRMGDGWYGWPEAAPFDAIVVTAAPTDVPAPLLAQLVVGGRLVVPVGPRAWQELMVVERTATGFERERVEAVSFVPMTGRALLVEDG
jgi:protein-L-isoaspartate(D-aspartate) O-methyltransferase